MKAKGNAFEREICKRLSLWWSGGDNEDIFWRSSNSGGRATVRSKGGKSTTHSCGDMVALDPIGKPFTDLVTVEIKRGYNKSTILDLLDSPSSSAKPVWQGWLEQVMAAAKAAGTEYWLVIHKRDRRRAIVYMPNLFFERYLGIFVNGIFMNCVFCRLGECKVVGLPLEEFCLLINPDLISG